MLIQSQAEYDVPPHPQLSVQGTFTTACPELLSCTGYVLLAVELGELAATDCTVSLPSFTNHSVELVAVPYVAPLHPSCSSRFHPTPRNTNWSVLLAVSVVLTEFGFVMLVPSVIVYAVAPLFTLSI